MPPRKKHKTSTNATATPNPDGDAIVVDKHTAQAEEPSYDPLKDPWTDEQETSLFTGIMKWKPNGMHKHFRMIALSEHLRNHGYDPQVQTHTSIQGIWAKLGTMYNMPIIDDRENSFEYDEDVREKFEPFSLPGEWEEELFLRGKKSVGSSEAPSSPPQVESATVPTKKRKRGDTVTAKTRASTVEDTDERESSAQTPPPAKTTTRSGRTTTRGKGKAAAESSRSRQLSKETSADEESEEEEEGEDETQDGEEGTPSPKIPKGKLKGKADQAVSRKSKRKK